MIELIAYVGGILLAVSSAPQVYECYKKKSVAGLSLPMIILILCGLLCNMIYGLCTHQPSLYLPLIISLFWNIIIAWMFLQYPSSNRDIDLNQLP